MLDALCMIVLLAFFGILIYSIATQPGRTRPAPIVPPSPVGLFCSLCQAEAGIVSHEEYMRITRAGVPVYCKWCVVSIEAYKRQQTARAGDDTF